jgi:hypothetical protein
VAKTPQVSLVQIRVAHEELGAGLANFLGVWRLLAVKKVMKTKTLSLAAGSAALLFASCSIASTNPVISSSSENSVRISSARVVRALGGGSYVTGMTEPSFGYVAPRAVHVHVAAYDANGKLLGEKIDKINGNNLVKWHLRPRPRAPYTVFFPWEPSQIAKATVIEHSGYAYPAS